MRDLLLPGLFAAVSIPLWITDVRSLRLPNRLLLPAAAAVAPAACVLRGVTDACGGALYVAGVLLFARRVTGGALGGGDVKYGAVIGLAVGMRGGPLVLLLAACLAAAALWVAALRSTKPRREAARRSAGPGGPGTSGRPGGSGRPAVPFAPALGLAALVSMMGEILGGAL
jgi:leader peptidase (prepilin peptidase)/N-methyltransferase